MPFNVCFALVTPSMHACCPVQLVYQNYCLDALRGTIHFIEYSPFCSVSALLITARNAIQKGGVTVEKKEATTNTIKMLCWYLVRIMITKHIAIHNTLLRQSHIKLLTHQSLLHYNFHYYRVNCAWSMRIHWKSCFSIWSQCSTEYKNIKGANYEHCLSLTHTQG